MTFTNYKSFYGSREIKFTKGFTLIQGANGSGKSNILDGFSFVLGGRDERTDKVLEVITRKGGKYLTNSAEVKIVFDNSDRKFPFDMDEVTVLRQIRLTPKGSHYSVYKLNDETTSLTAISENLAKAGVTVEGYNMIKQGKIVERATEDPESRRQLLENIAGTSKFDAEINEIEARILSINDKLNQLELYLGDSYRIIESLEKEKNRTMEFEELDKRLRENKVLRFRHIKRHHENDREKISKTLKQLEVKTETLSKKIEKYSESMHILQTQKEALESEERRIAKNKAKTEGLIEGFNSELSRLKNEARLLDLRTS
jgi:chromosome segregation protein